MQDLLGTLSPYDIHQEQDYGTESRIAHSQPREDEIDLPAAGPNTLSQYQGGASQDPFGKNVDEYLQVPTAPAWNPAIAAQQSLTTLGNTLQRIQLSVPHLATPRQQGYLISDEGYYTYQKSQQDTRSVRSNRSNSFNHMINKPQAIPRTMPDEQRARGFSQGQVSDYSMASQHTPTRGGTKSDAISHVGTISCTVEGCETMSKTPSDQKKHLARHKLEHVCTEVDCTRKDKGFATVNDLNRHRITVHKLTAKGARTYRCFALGCNKPEKNWPRKDNFRSHLKKAHPNEDVDELTRRSEEWWEMQQQRSTGSDDQQLFMNSALPIADYSHPAARPTVSYGSTSASDSGHIQTSSVPQTQFSHNPYIPQGAQFASNPLPGTIQQTNQQHALRHNQSATTSGYRNENRNFTNVRSSGPSSGRFHPSSSVTLSEQQISQHHRPSVVGPTMSYARTEQQTEHPQIREWTTPMPFSSMQAPSHVSRTASYNRSALQLPAQNQTAGQRPQTVADFRTLEEDRQEDMTDFSAFQQFQEPHGIEFIGQSNDLSNIGFSMGDDNPFDAMYRDDVMPDNRMQHSEQADIDLVGEDGAGGVNVDSLNKFLQPFTAKADDDPDKHQMVRFLKTALLSLESTTGDASSAAMNIDTNIDHCIEEIPNAAGKTVFRCKWPKCMKGKKEWNLRSEIKKHMKRHSKPYGCTFDKCYRQFGSKSDWVRHETNRHTLQESWRCMLTSHVAPAIQPCRTVFWARQHFIAHLSSAHRLTKELRPDEFNSQLSKQHINSNFQPQYWCGFHKSIIRLTKKGTEGIHERYNHIVEHITGEGRCMDDWMPAHGILSRGQLRAKQPPKQGQLANEEEYDASPPISTSEESNSTADGSPSPPQGNLPTEHRPARHRQVRQPSHVPAPTPHAGQKRKSSTAGFAHSHQPARRVANYWRCHACQQKNLLAISEACTSGSCSHEKCSLCKLLYQSSSDEI